jgi:ABC-type thiamine transport system substrate-binding protein
MPVTTTYTTSQIKEYLMERTQYFQAAAVRAKGHILSREGCSVPMEEAWDLYHQELNFMLLDILEAIIMGLELCMVCLF